MAATIQIPQDISISSPLGALITHFNGLSQSVQKALAKLMLDIPYNMRISSRRLKEVSKKSEMYKNLSAGR